MAADAGRPAAVFAGAGGAVFAVGRFFALECVCRAGEPGFAGGRLGGVRAFGGGVLAGGAAIGCDLAAAGGDGLFGAGWAVFGGAGIGDWWAGAPPGAGGRWQPLVGVVGGTVGRAAAVCAPPLELGAIGTGGAVGAERVGRLAKSQLGLGLVAGVGNAGGVGVAAQALVGGGLDADWRDWHLAVGTGPAN